MSSWERWQEADESADCMLDNGNHLSIHAHPAISRAAELSFKVVQVITRHAGVTLWRPAGCRAESRVGCGDPVPSSEV